MRRLRNSSRCWRMLIEPSSRSSSCFVSRGSATRSGIVVLRDAVLYALGQAVKGAVQGEILVSGKLFQFRLDVLARIGLFQFQLSHLFMDLRLEFVAGFLEFGHEFTGRASQFRKLAWSKKDERQKDDKNHFRDAQIHKKLLLIILQSSLKSWSLFH